MNALKSILTTNGFGYVMDNDIIQVFSRTDLEELGEDLIARTFDLEYAKADAILSQVQSLLSRRGKVTADVRTNSITVMDTPDVIAKVGGLISGLDRQGKQVLIEAKIMEASLEFIRSLGIQWGVTKSGGKINIGGLTAVGTDEQGRSLMLNVPASGYRGSAPISGLGLVLGSFGGVLTDAQISAAERNGDLNVLARPTIVTLDNQPAKIRSGTKFYVKTTGDFNIGGTTTTQSNLQEINTGIELNVTPHVAGDGFIKLDIVATQSEADFAQAIDGIPAVDDKTAETSVQLRDGETTIIGGLFSLKDAKTVQGIPGLMKVPIFGNLFKSKTKTKSKRELLIFLTPRVVDSAVAELPYFEEPESMFNPAPPKEDEKPKRIVKKRRPW
jgi:type IV pilus assembly protein PilQ